MSLRVYLVKRAIVYIMVFYIATTLVWLLIRLAPGDPALMAVGQMAANPTVPLHEQEKIKQRYIELLGLNKPLYEQYVLYWSKLFRGDLGLSLMVGDKILDEIMIRLRNDLILLTPAALVSWFIGNWVGAIAARYKKIDKVVIPLIYVLTSIPYFLMGLVFAYVFGVTLKLLPPSTSSTDIENFIRYPSWETFELFIKAYTMPFLSLVLVSIGGWASGMRTLMIYELESNYARYMESLGFSERKVASYAFRYAINPQIAGLGIQLGTLIVAGIVVSSVFNYPGVGILLIYAINRRDIYLIQGIVIIYTLMVIIANYVVDLVYALIDPRVRLGVVGV